MPAWYGAATRGPWGGSAGQLEAGGGNAQVSCRGEPDLGSGGAAGRAGKRISAGPCSFFVIVPDTKAAQYDPVAAGGVLPQPGMWWWATYYGRPATDEEATSHARERLSLMLAGLAALGLPVEGELGSPAPLAAIEKACADRQFDEIIMTTLPSASRAG